MTDHISRTFDQELDGLRRLVAEMGGLGERMLADATTALMREDAKRAQSVIATDPRLDELQRKIEDTAVLVLMRRQPVANDLREVMASIRIANDLERIGDLAKNIAKRSLKLQGHMLSGSAMGGIEALSRLALGPGFWVQPYDLWRLKTAWGSRHNLPHSTIGLWLLLLGWASPPLKTFASKQEK